MNKNSKAFRLIGLTGTTGAGKGLVRSVFEKRGYASIDADLLAREIMKSGVVLNDIARVFGNDVVKDNKLDRRLLAQRAFKDKESADLLNSITHPYIGELFVSQVKDLVSAGKTDIVFDAPQLFESGLNVLCDSIVSVLADENLRIRRIMLRDNISAEEAKRRIGVQYSDDFFRANSDFVIENNSDTDALAGRVNDIIDML